MFLQCISLHLLSAEDRVSVKDLSVVLREDNIDDVPVLLDVRPAVEFEICRLPNFISILANQMFKSFIHPPQPFKVQLPVLLGYVELRTALVN